MGGWGVAVVQLGGGLPVPQALNFRAGLVQEPFPSLSPPPTLPQEHKGVHLFLWVELMYQLDSGAQQISQST